MVENVPELREMRVSFNRFMPVSGLDTISAQMRWSRFLRQTLPFFLAHIRSNQRMTGRK